MNLSTESKINFLIKAQFLYGYKERVQVELDKADSFGSNKGSIRKQNTGNRN